MSSLKGTHLELLDDAAIKDRFQQFMQGARELLSDFRWIGRYLHFQSQLVFSAYRTVL